ncbi:hypothetical protein HK104_009585 [Borealophlyctis nickersoniae]|nr:hypothetical protein HK104_009585 [Borealophlyctis nickersoniae]
MLEVGRGGWGNGPPAWEDAAREWKKVRVNSTLPDVNLPIDAKVPAGTGAPPSALCEGRAPILAEGSDSSEEARIIQSFYGHLEDGVVDEIDVIANKHFMDDLDGRAPKNRPGTATEAKACLPSERPAHASTVVSHPPVSDEVTSHELGASVEAFLDENAKDHSVLAGAKKFLDDALEIIGESPPRSPDPIAKEMEELEYPKVAAELPFCAGEVQSPDDRKADAHRSMESMDWRPVLTGLGDISTEAETAEFRQGRIRARAAMDVPSEPCKLKTVGTSPSPPKCVNVGTEIDPILSAPGSATAPRAIGGIGLTWPGGVESAGLSTPKGDEIHPLGLNSGTDVPVTRPVVDAGSETPSRPQDPPEFGLMTPALFPRLGDTATDSPRPLNTQHSTLAGPDGAMRLEEILTVTADAGVDLDAFLNGGVAPAARDYERTPQKGGEGGYTVDLDTPGKGFTFEEPDVLTMPKDVESDVQRQSLRSMEHKTAHMGLIHAGKENVVGGVGKIGDDTGHRNLEEPSRISAGSPLSFSWTEPATGDHEGLVQEFDDGAGHCSTRRESRRKDEERDGFQREKLSLDIGNNPFYDDSSPPVLEQGRGGGGSGHAFPSNQSLGTAPSFSHLLPIPATAPLILRTRLRNALDFVLNHLVFCGTQKVEVDYQGLYESRRAEESEEDEAKGGKAHDDVIGEALHPLLKKVFKLDPTLLIEICGRLVVEESAEEGRGGMRKMFGGDDGSLGFVSYTDTSFPSLALCLRWKSKSGRRCPWHKLL